MLSVEFSYRHNPEKGDDHVVKKRSQKPAGLSKSMFNLITDTNAALPTLFDRPSVLRGKLGRGAQAPLPLLITRYREDARFELAQVLGAHRWIDPRCCVGDTRVHYLGDMSARQPADPSREEESAMLRLTAPTARRRLSVPWGKRACPPFSS